MNLSFLFMFFISRAIGCRAGRNLQQQYGSNTDNFLLYNHNGVIQNWNLTDREAAGATNAKSNGYYVYATGVVSVGSVVLDGKANKQPSSSACAASCASRMPCNTFNFCEEGRQRCTISLLGMALTGGSCELRSQASADLGRGMYVAAGDAGISTGAPVTVDVVTIGGYQAFIGIAFGSRKYNYDCQATYKRGVCMIAGTPKELAAACDADVRCIGFAAFPNGSSDLIGTPIGYLLGDATGALQNLDLKWSNFNPVSILYINSSTLPQTGVPVELQTPSAPLEAASPPSDTMGSEQDVTASTDAAPVSQGDEQSSTIITPKSGKSLQGLSFAGVIVGAGVAAACLGVLVGYIVFKRRQTVGSAPGKSPGKLHSLQSSDIAVSPSVTRRSKLSPPSRSISKTFLAAVQSIVPSSSTTSTEQGEETSSTERALEESPSQAVISKLMDAMGTPQEAGTLWRLRHPNIVAFMGIHVSSGKGVIMMEYMAGKDLGSVMGLRSTADGGRIFGWHNRGRRVALEVALGLAHLHQHQIVHFDLKPQNILLTNPGFTAKIGDYGFARIRNQTMIRDVGSRIGTFHWCSPEVLCGEACNEKTDIYSYGVCLWEICSGEPPQRGQMARLRVPEDCPQEVAELQERCVSADPQERPSAPEIVEIINSLASPQRPRRRQGSAGLDAQPRGGPPGSPAAARGHDAQHAAATPLHAAHAADVTAAHQQQQQVQGAENAVSDKESPQQSQLAAGLTSATQITSREAPSQQKEMVSAFAIP